jgi:two-component system sensor histidine kinase UhpB
VGQNLTALNLNLKRLQNKLSGENKDPLQNILTDSANLLEETTRQVRSVMADLNPPMLEEYGLVPAMSWYGDKFCERTGVAVHITGDQLKLRMPQRVELTLFRIAQECLNNVAKHAQASHVEIVFQVSRDAVIMSLEDNGAGFEPENVSAKSSQPHWGLLTMKERALSVGGELSIHTAVGKGTRVEVTVRRMQDGDYGLLS